MASIVVFFLVVFQVLFDLFDSGYRNGDSDELTSLLGEDAFGEGGYGVVGVVEHGAKITNFGLYLYKISFDIFN